jgi:hypothetical protein
MNRLTMHILKSANRRNDMTMTMNIPNSRMDSHTICIFVYRLSTSAPDIDPVLKGPKTRRDDIGVPGTYPDEQYETVVIS